MIWEIKMKTTKIICFTLIYAINISRLFWIAALFSSKVFILIDTCTNILQEIKKYSGSCLKNLYMKIYLQNFQCLSLN